MVSAAANVSADNSKGKTPLPEPPRDARTILLVRSPLAPPPHIRPLNTLYPGGFVKVPVEVNIF
jgi:hypothetical protein